MFIVSMAAALAGATPVPPNDADARCAAVLALLVSESEGDAQKSVITGLLYYIGKLKGHDPSANIEAQLRAGYRVDPKVLEADKARCLGEIGKVGEEMSKAGAAIQANP